MILVNSLLVWDDDVGEEGKGVYEVFREWIGWRMDGCVIRRTSSESRKRKERRRKRKMKW